MPLKFRFKAREEIPAKHQALYVERDGAWGLDVEGAVEKTRLADYSVESRSIHSSINPTIHASGPVPIITVTVTVNVTVIFARILRL